MTKFYDEKNHQKRDRAWTVAFIAVLAATAIGGNYALSGIPNIELSSVMVFLSGFLFGYLIGISVGLISMGIYQLWNPWGAFIPPIGLAVIGCTMFIGLIGGILGQSLRTLKLSETKLYSIPAAFGLILTLFYDLVTNFAYSLTFGIPYFITFISGLPFIIIHLVSNTLLFGFLIAPVSHTVTSLLLWHPKKPDKRTLKTNNLS